MQAEQLFQTGLKGLLPLIPLTQDGQQHEVVERVIDELQQSGVKKSGDLLSLTYNLAGLVFEGESEQLWLRRRFAMLKDILKESWTYQEIKKEGRAEGLEQGLQAQRQSLILLIQKLYPALIQLAEDVCNTIRTLEELQDLFQKVLLAKDEQEVRQLLLSVQK
jgi:predicted transposase YdaD